VFVGEWKLDMRLNGEMTMSDGTIYKGGFYNDLFHGRGKLILK
jgi:hypothetical protein